MVSSELNEKFKNLLLFGKVSNIFKGDCLMEDTINKFTVLTTSFIFQIKYLHKFSLQEG